MEKGFIPEDVFEKYDHNQDTANQQKEQFFRNAYDHELYENSVLRKD